MNFYDWMLALHLLAAFAIASALVLYTVLVFSGRRDGEPRADGSSCSGSPRSARR